MDFFMRNILVLVCLFPLAGIPIILLLPRGARGATKRSNGSPMWSPFLGFLISLPLITRFNRPEFIDADTGNALCRSQRMDQRDRCRLLLRD